MNWPQYELLLDCANAGSRKRPDLSCIVDDVPILNSEFKPLVIRLHTTATKEGSFKSSVKGLKINQSATGK